MTVNYFYFVPCCQGGTELFFSGSPDSVENGVYLYEGNCYTVVYVYKTLNEDLSPIVPGALTLMDNCEVEDCKCCKCIRVRSLFSVVPVSVNIVNCNDDDEWLLIPINRVWSEKICAKSWQLDETIFEVEVFDNCTVDEAPSGCSEHVITIPIDSSAGIIRYTNCKNIEHTINYPAVFYSPLTFEFCALDSVPIFAPGASSDVVIGNCSPNQTYSCPINTCFLLIDCEGVEDDIYVTYNSIENYINSGDSILKIDGYPNTCWGFREISECECAIEVTVVSSWVDCEECRKCKGYKLTNCENSTYIKYTTNDLSEYIGKSVEFENCPGCWTVECMEIAPPADQNLIVAFAFDNCEDCLKTFWKLTTCVGDVTPIYTNTDLSPYIGFTITLDNIPGTCWTFEEVRDLEGNAYETVFLNSYYTDCVTCLVDILDCQCSTAVNGSPDPAIFHYLDCNGEVKTTRPILPGQRTTKMCVVGWDPNNEYIVDIEWYGECTEVLPDNTEIVGDNPLSPSSWLCPIAIVKVRSVRPGYNTPACSADYFDKISCKFSEALYKDVLAERYGINTNCSKAELEKWEVKKELLNLAAITNPDYDCPPVTGCYDPCNVTPGLVQNCVTEEVE
jgi:hypothetical protein